MIADFMHTWVVFRKSIYSWCRCLFEYFGSDLCSHLALNDLDRKLAQYLDYRSGTFIEVGANDGLSQSNTYWFERFRDWRGILIEPIPDKAEECRRNRPLARVVTAALVADETVRRVRMKTANLMAFVSGSLYPEAESIHVRDAMRVQHLAQVREIEVPARTLASILNEFQVDHVDLFSLDVEGYELEVLKGMDVTKHAPAHILVETKQLDQVLAVLEQRYEVLAALSHHDHLLRLKA